MISRLALSFAGLIFILASQSSSADVATASAAKPSQRVLVIYSDERLLPANVIIDEAIRTTFSAQNDRQAEFHSEFLDRARFPSEAQEQRERDFLRNKYQDRMPDLVIAVSGFAVDLLVKYRADLFRDVPIVFCSVAGDTRPLSRWMNESLRFRFSGAKLQRWRWRSIFSPRRATSRSWSEAG